MKPINEKAISSREYNYYKHICTKQQNQRCMKQTLTELKEEIC